MSDDPLTTEQREERRRQREIADAEYLQRKAAREDRRSQREERRSQMKGARAQQLVLQGLREVADALHAEPHHPRAAELMQQAKPLLQALPPGPDADEIRQRFERIELTTLRNLVDPPTLDG